MSKLRVYFYLLVIVLVSNTVFAKSSVWIAEKDGHSIIIAGSVHLVHPSQLPLPAEYLKAFSLSERVVFEIDLDEMNQSTSLVKMISAFRLKATTLDKTLRSDVWQDLNTVMKEYNVPHALLAYDAAFMSFSLPLIIWKSQGYQEGIDKLLYDQAKRDGKKIIGLETFDEQLKALVTLQEIDPNILIKQTLKEIKKPQFSLDNLIKELYQGQQTMLEKQIAIYDTKEMESFYQTLLINRNKAWIPKIDQLAKDSKSTMVIVGAMHLAGNDSVLQLLKEQGYNISYYE